MTTSPIISRSYLPSSSSSPSRPFDRSLPGTSSPTPLSRNPVSLRIYKVLGANFDDEATKEALTTLSDLYSSSSSTNGTTVNGNGLPPPKEPKRRPSAYLDSDDSEDDDGEAGKRSNGIAGRLSFLEGSPPGDTAVKARKNLRRDIERKLADGSQKFLKAFGEVDQVGATAHYKFGSRCLSSSGWLNICMDIFTPLRNSMDNL